MGRHFAEIAFTPAVQAEQQQVGSLVHYAQVATLGRDDSVLAAREVGFIQARDSVYMATVSETGWPYVQHRGGPPGFVRVLGERTIAFADLTGNRQHISLGNLANNDRVSLFFMDYPNRRRLKLLGHARVVRDDPALLVRLTPPGAERIAESAVVIEVAGHDWNCPQHITPRLTLEEWQAIATSA